MKEREGIRFRERERKKANGNNNKLIINNRFFSRSREGEPEREGVLCSVPVFSRSGLLFFFTFFYTILNVYSS